MRHPTTKDLEMPSWNRVAHVDQVPPGTGLEATIEDRIVAIYNVDGEFHAMDGICAHAGGPVATGTLTGCIVTCPWHGWQYDVTTGIHCLNDQICQERFAVKVEDDEIFVELP